MKDNNFKNNFKMTKQKNTKHDKYKTAARQEDQNWRPLTPKDYLFMGRSKYLKQKWPKIQQRQTATPKE